MKNFWKKAFTLVEIMVAVTIFWVVMVSVMWIYIVSTEATYKSDINRLIHENVKNIVTNLNESVLKEWIKWVSSYITSSCDLWTWEMKSWIKLCTWNWEYFLKDLNWQISDINKCKKEDCFLVRKETNESKVSNNLVAIRDLKFYVTNNSVPKVTVYMKLQPSSTSWVRKSLIEQSTFELQTTISSRQ